MKLRIAKARRRAAQGKASKGEMRLLAQVDEQEGESKAATTAVEQQREYERAKLASLFA
jgi:hypothetical protein